MNLQGNLLLILLASECTLYSSLGAAITSMDCSSSGVVGNSHDIRCSVAGTITDGIIWTRPDNIAVVACNLQHICIPIKGYDVPFANATLYILNIKSLREVDGGGWVCRDGSEGTLAKGCSLTVDARPTSPTDVAYAIRGSKVAGMMVAIFAVYLY